MNPVYHTEEGLSLHCIVFGPLTLEVPLLLFVPQHFISHSKLYSDENELSEPHIWSWQKPKIRSGVAIFSVWSMDNNLWEIKYDACISECLARQILPSFIQDNSELISKQQNNRGQWSHHSPYINATKQIYSCFPFWHQS